MSNQNRDHYDGSPEKYLVVDSSDSELDTDAISCAILRAQAQVALLHTQFAGGKDTVRVTDHILVDALWGITGYLDQIKILTRVG